MQTGILDRCASAERAKGIGGEHADDIRIRLQDGGRLRLCRISTVLVIVDAGDDQTTILSGGETALLALIGSADARARVGDVNLRAFAERVRKRRTGDESALRVVRADVADREGDLAVGVVAIANESVDRQDDDSGFVSVLQDRYRLFLVIRRGD